MAMLEKQVTEGIESLKKKFADDSKVREFEKSVIQFEELVRKGIARKRGNNLLSASDGHVKNQVWFNAEANS